MAAALLRAVVSACATGRVSVVVACAGRSAFTRIFSVAGVSIAADAPRALWAEAALRAGAAVPCLVRSAGCAVARSAAFDLVRVRSVVCAARAELDLVFAAVLAVDRAVADLTVSVLAAVSVLADVLEAAVFAVLAAAVFMVRFSAPAFDLAPAPALLALVLPAFVLPMLLPPTLFVAALLAAALAVRDRLDLASASLAPRVALAGALRFFADFLLEGIRGYSSSCPAVETGRKATRPGSEAAPRPG
ncbi:hypothetical protein CQW49_18555 [Methylosinus trichosporium OB3b]|uniref:Uncharacterized protein n=1 Tax=Methylosinus trichosporium (strain ATCC 35070 / NCIMB 11131 / UNIQEM 75 / OB3b) TaxID=595536 RepID=A0A2D2D3T2_METT3|nr:hypothetical protein CQW49_18555 [Methylosinus trichosporium OB3b]OBS51253.1 hypothetical protein A8B73_17540 [Methylosinus sp. 3S-1]